MTYTLLGGLVTAVDFESRVGPHPVLFQGLTGTA